MVPQNTIKPTFRLYDAGETLDKKWFVYWYEGGKRQRKYGDINSGKTIADRKKNAKLLISQLKRSHTRRVSNTEIAMKKAVEKHSVRWTHKTKQDHYSKWNNLLEWLGGREVTAKLMEEFFTDLHKRLNPTTINKYRSVLLMLFTSIGMEWLFDDIPILKASYTPKRYFQRHQARWLGMEISKNDPDLWFFIQLMYYCFLRPKEIRFTKVSDFQLDEMIIRVRGEVSKNRRIGYIAIPDAFAPECNILYNRSPNEYLFEGRKGNPLGANTMAMRFRKYLKKMNFGREYSLYSWRHTGAVAAAKSGASLKELQLQFRHHSLDQTDQYLRQLGVKDVAMLRKMHPHILHK